MARDYISEEFGTEAFETEFFTLQLLHASDQEAGVPALTDIIGFSAVLNQLASQGYVNSLRLTSGDTFIPSPFSNASQDASLYSGGFAGIADILIQNELGWDAAAVGNHEFGFGPDGYARLVAPAPAVRGAGIDPLVGYPGALFPYLALNLDYSTQPNLAALFVDGASTPLPNSFTTSIVIEMSGEQIGVIGAVTPYLASIANIGSLKVTTKAPDGEIITPLTPAADQAAALLLQITNEVDRLAEQGINMIVLMTHLQESAIEMELARQLAAANVDVDIHIGGGSHQAMSTSDGIPPLREDETQQISGQLLTPYPMAFEAEDQTVYYVNTAANYRYVSQLIVTFDAYGDIVVVHEESGTFGTDLLGVQTVYDDMTITVEDLAGLADPDIVAIIEPLAALINSLDGTIHGQSSVFLNGVRDSMRTEETNLGNLSTDAMRFVAQAYADADTTEMLPEIIHVAFRNGGSVRDYIGRREVPGGGGDLVLGPTLPNDSVGKEAGDISTLDISNALRFDGDNVVGTVTAQGLRALVEHGVSTAMSSTGLLLQNGRFGQWSGVTFEFDAIRPVGQRVRELSIVGDDGVLIDDIVTNGVLVGDVARVFGISAPRFLALENGGTGAGGDGYPLVIQNIVNLTTLDVPEALDNADLRPGRDQDTLAEYLAANFNAENGQAPFAEADSPVREDQRIEQIAAQFTRISEIQGVTDTSPFVGQTVTVRAVVVGDFQNADADVNRSLGGFYLQEEDKEVDGNPLTSEGLFVFDGTFGVDVKLGDRVIVTGVVQESFGMTRLGDVTVVEVFEENVVLPTAVVISLPAAGTTLSQSNRAQPDLEAFEGMRVVFEDTLTINEMFQLGRFNEIRLVQGDRPQAFTMNNDPDVAGFAAHLQEIGSREIVYDDGRNAQNLPVGTLDGFEGFNTANAPRMGDTVDGLTGVLDYQWAGNAASGATWRVRSTIDGSNEFERENERPEAPAETGGRLEVASFNVLNFFPTLNVNASSQTEIGVRPRGANNEAEYLRQIEKLVTTIIGIDADVIGLQELENDFMPGSTGNALETLVNEVNARLGAAIYGWVNPGTQFVGTDAIATGFMYDTRSVAVSGVAVLDNATFTAPLEQSSQQNRPAVTATFVERATGEDFTLSVNHFKSKGSGTGVAADEDQFDGQSASNATRVAAAEALAAWLGTDPTGTGDEDIMILGDLNSYSQEDPIRVLEALGYVNTVAAFNENEYSFVFSGQTGTLDYGLANAKLSTQVTGAVEWNAQADEASVLDYNLDFGRDAAYFDGQTPFRGSDHDAMIVGLTLDYVITEIFGTAGNDRLTGTDGVDRITSGAGRSDVMFGGGAADTFVFGAELANGTRETDTIRDFQVDLDFLDLDGFMVVGHQITASAVILTFSGDGDRAIVQSADEPFTFEQLSLRFLNDGFDFV